MYGQVICLCHSVHHISEIFPCPYMWSDLILSNHGIVFHNMDVRNLFKHVSPGRQLRHHHFPLLQTMLQETSLYIFVRLQEYLCGPDSYQCSAGRNVYVKCFRCCPPKLPSKMSALTHTISQLSMRLPSSPYSEQIINLKTISYCTVRGLQNTFFYWHGGQRARLCSCALSLLPLRFAFPGPSRWAAVLPQQSSRMLLPHPGHTPASPNCTFHCLFNIIIFFLIWSFSDFPTKISAMARESECKTQNNWEAQRQVAIGRGKFHQSLLFYLKILVLYKHTALYCTWLYCASQMVHFLFLTN